MKKKANYRILYSLLVGFLLFYSFYKGAVSISGSLFFSHPARMNIVFYGPATRYYSIDARDKQNYSIQFDPEVKVDVPGGYGQYRIGSLGKLVSLEKDPEIIKKAFSATTTTFVHYYFYQNGEGIYYDNTQEEDVKPALKDLFFYSSNASFLDRIYLAFLLSNINENYNKIRYRKETEEGLNDVLFQEKSFIQDSIGLLYNNDYREEQQTVQVLYRQNYSTAESVSSLLEGNGIRVSDINKNTSINDCKVVIGEGDELSRTAKDIARFFSCPIVIGKTDIYDILFVLGEKEGEWEVNSF